MCGISKSQIRVSFLSMSFLFFILFPFSLVNLPAASQVLLSSIVDEPDTIILINSEKDAESHILTAFIQGQSERLVQSAPSESKQPRTNQRNAHCTSEKSLQLFLLLTFPPWKLIKGHLGHAEHGLELRVAQILLALVWRNVQCPPNLLVLQLLQSEYSDACVRDERFLLNRPRR